MGRYDLDDQRDRLERELTYAQDKIRAEKDEIWEFYKKKTQYKHDDDRVLADEDYGDDYGYGYGHRAAVAEIVARREAEIAGLKAAVIERRMDKRADLAVANAELDQAIRDLIAAGNAEVGALNDTHQG